MMAKAPAWGMVRLFFLLIMLTTGLISNGPVLADSTSSKNLLPTACHFVSEVRPDFSSMLPHLTTSDCKTPAQRSSEMVWLSLDAEALQPEANTTYKLGIFRHWTERIVVQFHYSDGYMQSYDAGPYSIDNFWSVGNFIAFTAPARDAQVRHILVGLQNPSSVKLFHQMSFEKSEDWLDKQTSGRLLTFFITGILIAMLFYNIGLATVLRFDFHFHYILVVFAAVAYNVSAYGFLSYLMPGVVSYGTQMNITILALGLNGLASLLFFCSFIEKNILTPSWIWAARTLGALFFGLSIVFVNARGPYTELLENWLHIISFAGVIFILAALVRAIRMGSQVYIFFAIGWFLPLLGVVARNLREAGVIGHSDIVGYSVSVGFALETIIFALGIAHRISTIRKDRDDAKLASEKASAASQAKSDFLAHFSHEIRTPMNAIIGFSELMTHTKLDEKQQSYVQSIHKSGNILTDLLNDILDFSKIEAGKMSLEKVDFSPREMLDNVQAVVSPKADEKALSLVVEGDDSLPELLKGDPTRLSQILINLAGNAVKFTKEGCVTTSLSAKTEKSGKVILWGEVTDTGIGMTEAQLGKLFKSFSQADVSVARQYGGTGLGLAISKELVELMDGCIHVESEPGVGTRFFFKVRLETADAMQNPNLQEAVAARDEPNENPEQTLRGADILIVEDNHINQLLVSKTLESSGATFNFAANGEEAIKKAVDGRFSMILMDLHLPDIGGLEAVESIRSHAHARSIPIIAMTGSADDETRQACLESGMNDYVIKPFKQTTLMETLERWHTAQLMI